MKPNEWLKHIVSEVRDQALEDHLAPTPDLDFGVLQREAVALPCHARASSAVETIIDVRRNAVAPDGDLVERLASALAVDLADFLPVSAGDDQELARKAAWAAAIKGEIALPSMTIHFPVVFGANAQAAILRLNLYALPGAPCAVVMAPFVNHRDNKHTLLTSQVGETFVKALKAAAHAAGLKEGVAWSLEVARQPLGFPQATAWVDGGSVGVAAYLALRALNDARVASLDHLCVTGAVVAGEAESVDEVTAKYEAFIPWSTGSHRRRFLAECKPHNPDALKVRVFNSLEVAWTKATDPIPEPELPGQLKEVNDAFQASKQVRRDRCEKLYGRTAELDEIRSLVLNKGEGGLVIVHGPAGVGKSSSMSALCDVDYGDAAVIPFFISQRHAETQNWEIIQQTLLAQLKQAGIDEFTNLGDFARKYDGKRVILMVDGLDEAGIPSDALWNWKLSKCVTIVLGVRGTRSQVTERLPIFEQAEVRRSERPLEFFELGNLKETELRHWVSELLSGLQTFREATPEQQEAITGGFWRRTKGYPLFAEYLLRKLLDEKNRAETTDKLAEQVEQLPGSLDAFAADEWLDSKDENGSAWIATLAAARGPVDDRWLENLLTDLRPPALSQASQRVLRWVLEVKVPPEGGKSYDLGHPTLREAFRRVPDLQAKLADIDAAIAKATPHRLNERASDPDYRWEDAFGLDKYEARYLIDHLESVLECALGKLTTNGNDARRLWRTGANALQAALGDADHWAGWISEVGIPAIRRQLRRLRGLAERWTPKPKGLTELLTDLRDWIDGCGQHVAVGVNSLVLAANHAGMLPVSESARKRLDQRGDPWLCRVSPRTIRRSSRRVTALFEGNDCKFAALECSPMRVAVGTDAGEVFVLDEDGEVLPGSRRRVFGAVTAIVALSRGFAVGTNEGVVAMFDQDCKPAMGTDTLAPRVSGSVKSMVWHLERSIVIGTDRGVIALFDEDGKPNLGTKTKDASVRGTVTMIITVGDRFVVAAHTTSDDSVVCVFRADGMPVSASRALNPSISGNVESMIRVGLDRFAVASFEGFVAVFDSENEPLPDSNPWQQVMAGWIRELCTLDASRFVAYTIFGVMVVFNASGQPLHGSKLWEPSIVSWFTSLIRLSDSFILSSDLGAAIRFDFNGQPFDELPPNCLNRRSLVLIAELDSDRYVVLSGSGRISILASDGTILNHIDNLESLIGGQVSNMCPLADGHLAVSTAGMLSVIDLKEHESDSEYDPLYVPSKVIHIQPLDDDRLAVVRQGSIAVFNCEGRMLQEFTTQSLDLSGNARFLIPLGSDRFVVIGAQMELAVISHQGQLLSRSKARSCTKADRVRFVTAFASDGFAMVWGRASVAAFSNSGTTLPHSNMHENCIVGWITSLITVGLDRFAVATSEGVVAVFDKDGYPMSATDLTKPHVSGWITNMLPVSDNRFALGTREGIVAVFDLNGRPLSESSVWAPSINGWVTCMISLSPDRFAVGSDLGCIAVFDGNGVLLPECSSWVRCLDGKVSKMVNLGSRWFVAASDEGDVRVFDSEGQAHLGILPKTFSEHGDVISVLAIGSKRFAVQTRSALFFCEVSEFAIEMVQITGGCFRQVWTGLEWGTPLMLSEEGYLLQTLANSAPLLCDHVGRDVHAATWSTLQGLFVAAFDDSTGPFIYEFRNYPRSP